MFLYFRQPPLRIFVKLIPCCLKFVNYLKPCLYVQMKCVRKTGLAACAKNLLEKYRIPTCLNGVTLTTGRLCNAGDRYCKLIYHSHTWIVLILLESQESHAKMDQKSNLCEVWMIKTLWTSVVRQYLFYAPSGYCHSIFLQEDLLGTKVKKVLLIRSISEFLNPVPQKMSWHQNCKRCPSTSLYGLLSLYF